MYTHTATERRLLLGLRRAAEEYVKKRGASRSLSKDFYSKFLSSFVKQLTEGDRRRAIEFFGRETVRVAVVDGTRREEVRSGIVSFLVIAAPLTYEVDVRTGSVRREPLSEEYKVAALIPIPLDANSWYLIPYLLKPIDEFGQGNWFDRGEQPRTASS